MADSILQTYLNEQFIKTAEQENITKLKAAAIEVKKRLAKKKTKIIHYTLVALDPLIPENEPVIAEVEKIIITKWSTFKNSVSQTKDKPVNYIRAVILEALNSLSNDENFAVIIWHTGRNVISQYKLANEEVVVEEFLKKIGDKVESASRNYWGVKEIKANNSLPSIELNIDKLGSTILDKEVLREGILDGAQHSGWASYSESIGSNPSPPNSQNWASPFSTKAANTIAKEVNNALKKQNTNLNSLSESIQTELNDYFSSLTPYYKELSLNMVQGVLANNKRSELLWWKEALLSTSQNKSYRSLNSIGMAVTMAYDLSCFVDPIYPISIDFFLRETLRDILGDKIDSNHSLNDLLKEANELDLTIKNTLINLKDEREGRKSFGNVLANMLNEVSDINPFDEAGINDKVEITLADFTVWLFNDLQAHKIAIAK